MKNKRMKTATSPYDFEKELGTLKKVYATTFTSGLFQLYAFMMFTGIVSLVLLLISLAYGMSFGSPWNFIFIFLAVLLLIPLYIHQGRKYRFVVTYENGVLIKKRYSYVKFTYDEIAEIEYINLSPLKDLVQRPENQVFAIDVILKNDKFYSIGSSKRLSRNNPKNRYSTGVRVLDINSLYDELIESYFEKAKKDTAKS